jgi:hypothetical protein
MKDMNQNMTSGGRAAQGNFRQLEIRGQGCQRGQFPSNCFFRRKDLLLEKRNLSRVPPKLAGKILCNV